MSMRRCAMVCLSHRVSWRMIEDYVPNLNSVSWKRNHAMCSIASSVSKAVRCVQNMTH